MLVKLNILVCGYAVTTEIKVDDKELEGMTESEKDEYLEEECNGYVRENTSISYEEVEED